MPVPASTANVRFFFEKKGFSLAKRAALKSFIQSIFTKEKKPLSSINYIFCSDKRLLEINQQFLQHDYFTDIITFDLSESKAVEAEVYISIDRVKENARTLGISFKSELHRVIFHGALHLCGHGDKSGKEKREMRKLEEHYLRKYLESRFTFS